MESLKAAPIDAAGSVDKVIEMVDNPEHSAGIQKSNFEAALDGMRTDKMTYKGDAIHPAIESEMDSRLAKVRGPSKEEGISILALNDEQKKMLNALLPSEEHESADQRHKEALDKV